MFPRIQISRIVVVSMAVIVLVKSACADDWAKVLELEKSGDLRAAIRLVDAEPGIAVGHELHVESLRLANSALTESLIFEEANLPDEAVRTLDAALAKLAKSEHAPLRSVLGEKREQLAPQSVAEYWELAFAEKLIEAGKHELASKRLKALLDADPPTLSEADRLKALPLFQKAEEGVHLPESESVWSKVPDTFKSAATTIIMWLLYFGVFVGVVFASRKFSYLLPPLPGIRMDLDDASAATAERERSNRLLNGDFANYLRKVESSPTSGDGMLGDGNDSELVFGPSPLGELASLNAYIQEVDVSVGPVKFNARDLFNAIASIFKRRYRYTLVGSLTVSEWTTLTVEKFDFRGNRIKGAVFSANARGDKARDDVLRSVSAQLALHLAEGKVVTDSWRSLEHLLRAQDLLSEEGLSSVGKESLAEAAQHLELSLAHDQGNWIAQFQLAGTMRKLGRYRSSADRYCFIRERLMVSEALKGSAQFKDYLGEQPDFEWMLRYNEAVSRIRVRDRKERHGAGRLIEGLFEDMATGVAKADGSSNSVAQAKAGGILSFLSRSETGVERAARLRREVLARSARAECNAMRVELARFSKDTAKERAYIDACIQKIEEDEKWLWACVDRLDRENLTEYTYAHMVARNAMGRACYLQGSLDQAATYLRWAIDFHGSAPNIDARVNLASVYIKGKRKVSQNWIQEVQALLEKVLEYSPRHSKANYLLGKLHAGRDLSDPLKAKAYFEAAGDGDTRSLFELGLLYIKYEDELEKGLACLARSLRSHFDHDYHQREFLFWVVRRLRREEGISREVFTLAERAVEALEKSSKERNQSRAAEAKAELLAYRKKLKEKAAKKSEEEASEEEPPV